MISAINIILLTFAAAGFAGAGAALAVGRARQLMEGEADFGMRVVAIVLMVFAALCTSEAAGLLGVMAFGSVITWSSYVLSAHRIGVFRIAHFESLDPEHVER